MMQGPRPAWTVCLDGTPPEKDMQFAFHALQANINPALEQLAAWTLSMCTQDV